MPIPKNPIDQTWTILKIIQWATSYLKSHQIDSPRLTIEILLAHVLGVARIDLYLNFDKPLCVHELTQLKNLIKRRIQGEPVAYIIGKKEFYGLEFHVSPDVLIPRPETEFLVEAALDFLPDISQSPAMRILDMGTGSGAVVIAIAKNRPGHYFFASDISVSALGIAKANAKQHGMDNIWFFAGDWDGPLCPNAPAFDLIVSNPPYIPQGEINGLAPDIARYEPRVALNGGHDGLCAIRALLAAGSLLLAVRGFLMLEIGFNQRDGICREVFRHPDLKLEKFVRDYRGHDRVAVIQKIH